MTLRDYFAGLLAFLFAVFSCPGLSGQTLIKVWDENDGEKGNVTLKAYVPSPDRDNAGAAVIICPGGSYFWLADIDEGGKVGECLCRHGVAAFVLSYRVAGKFNFITDMRFLYRGTQYPSMLEDAQRSVQIVRNLSSEYGIDKDRIGIMGFSAGGHLALLCEEIGCTDPARSGLTSSKPDFVAMIYPVVSLSDPRLVHKRSRRGILGTRDGDTAMRDSLSLEKHVPDGCCPVFLLHCEDDRVVNSGNSAVLDSVLTAKNITHRFINPPCGGHGFGVKEIEKDGRPYFWINDFLSWLKEI